MAADAGDIVGLVYVAAFAPSPGESCFELSLRFPGSTLGDAVQPIPHHDGTSDLVIAHDRFHDQFCADLPVAQAGLMAATQRPVAQAALQEPSGPTPLWERVPSYFVIGGADRNIPAQLQRSLADRARRAAPSRSRGIPRRRRLPSRRDRRADLPGRADRAPGVSPSIRATGAPSRCPQPP